jgi:hypothetical protein
MSDGTFGAMAVAHAEALPFWTGIQPSLENAARED